MRIVVPKEVVAHETRVALIPETVAKLVRDGFSVRVEKGAGVQATHMDSAYVEAGAEVAPDPAALYDGANVVVKVRSPVPHPAAGRDEVELLPEGVILVGILEAATRPDLVDRLRRRRINAFALELLPRISRAQKMDVLSSMSTVAGYKAALLAADSLNKFFPLLMTAAGTIAPAKVHVLGAGVAGLQAIATARRLGAVVEASDIRPAVREEVQSLGASFVDLHVEAGEAVGEGGYAKELSQSKQDEERRILAERLRLSDCVIATAMVPGKRAPRLITRDMVESMKYGSIIVDLAAEQGGNCELTQPGRTVTHAGITIYGPVHLVASVPTHASQMYSRNVYAFLGQFLKGGRLELDFSDEILRSTCVTGGPSPASAGAPVSG